MRINMRTKRLFLCHPKLRFPNSFDDYDHITLYCYAYSTLDAVQLATNYCIAELNWELNTFVVPEPVWIPNFIDHGTRTQ